MEDAKDYHPQDVGANTLCHIIDHVPSIQIPSFEKLGINKIINHPTLQTIESPLASYG